MPLSLLRTWFGSQTRLPQRVRKQPSSLRPRLEVLEDRTVMSALAPAFTSPASTTFTVGTPGSFTVTTSGSSIPSLSESGSLPSGVSFAGLRQAQLDRVADACETHLDLDALVRIIGEAVA